jgi:hypothetical protein
VVWLQGGDLVDDRTAEEIFDQLRDQKRGGRRRDAAVEEAEEFLKRILVGELLAPVEIFKLAKDEGISVAAIRRAKKNLELITVMSKDFPAKVIGWQYSAQPLFIQVGDTRGTEEITRRDVEPHVARKMGRVG